MQNLSSDLIVSFRNGSTQAFTKIYNYYYRQVFYFAKRMLNSGPDAEDVVAEIFIKIWHKREDFETLHNVKAFLFIATRNACLNLLRSSGTRSVAQRELAYLADEEDSILHHEITVELLSRVYHDIEQLPPKRRRIVKLILKGFSDKQIAEQLNITAKTVRNQKANAIQLLRAAFIHRASYSLAAIGMLYHFLKR
ncbi:MAG: RNA polymerase sigma-70 factor [Candidatus Pseudobacter hemicellulosilyticus]|uniref:RNA polymerase sigma factor SigS n=1 Tax=Candidatus Pseudobacter hemicellulosilyticus TaxID=3121375 RepID=A0AAJ5WSS3_9BACT|nr:MAG: RNA polymerase sigma-70 factor [Pseudobacter sp.]